MGLFFGKKRPTEAAPAPEKPTAPQPTEKVTPDAGAVALSVHFTEMKEAIEAAYAAKTTKEQDKLFSIALKKGAMALMACENIKREIEGDAPLPIEDSILCYVCEALYQQVCIYDDTGNGEARHDAYLTLQRMYACIQKPNAAAHFTMACGLLADTHITNASQEELREAFGHFEQAHMTSAAIDPCINERLHIYPMSCYHLGMFCQAGLGVERDIKKARLYFTKAQEAGLDCQEMLDSLL